jgi:hypothetical protein
MVDGVRPETVWPMHDTNYAPSSGDYCQEFLFFLISPEFKPDEVTRWVGPWLWHTSLRRK